MSRLQIKTIRDYFKDIRRYVAKSKNINDLNSQWAQEHESRLAGYILALYQIDVVTEEQYYRILEIARNWAIYGNSKGNKAA